MATLLSVVALLETKIEALAGSPIQYPDDDYRDDVSSPLTASQSYYQIQDQHQVENDADSNAPHKSAAIVIRMHHKLASVTGERAYTEGNMHEEQHSLLAKAFWLAPGIAGVQLVLSGPELVEDVTREGNVMSWAVGVEIQLTNT